MERLAAPIAEAALAAVVEEADGADALAQLYYLLGRLVRRGLIVRSLWSHGARLAVLTSISSSFEAAAPAPSATYALSRFAYLRVEGGETIVESPLAPARLVVHDRRVAALLHELARPVGAAELAERLVDLPAPAIQALLGLLGEAGLLRGAEDQPALSTWEFHDLLFHARTRFGRHDYPMGGTYRFADRLPPPPAVKRLASEEHVVDLHRPDLAELDRTDPRSRACSNLVAPSASTARAPSRPGSSASSSTASPASSATPRSRSRRRAARSACPSRRGPVPAGAACTIWRSTPR